MANSNNKKFWFNEHGTPMVAYVPDRDEQVPVPDIPEGMVEFGINSYKTVSCYNPQLLQNIWGCDEEEFEEIVVRVREVMQDWKKRAKESGHPDAFLIYDGSGFSPVYLRPATIDEVMHIKQDASMVLRWEARRQDRYSADVEAARENLHISKDMLEKKGD